MAQTYVKGATEVASFSIDWEDKLGSATISTSVWSCETGITEDSESETNTVATVVLSGGTAGTTYTCTNTITTSDSQTWPDSLYIIVPSDTMFNLFRDLRDDLKLTTATDDGQIYRKLEQAVKGAETHCGRKFLPVAATRYYESEDVDGYYLHLDDDLISVTTLTNGDSSATVIADTEYWLWPRNDGPPYWAIRLEANSDYSWEVDTDYMISVEGSWGWASTIPDDVQRALIRWASYLYAQKDAPTFDTTVIPEAGVITVPQGIPADVKLLLAPYVRGPG